MNLYKLSHARIKACGCRPRKNMDRWRCWQCKQFLHDDTQCPSMYIYYQNAGTVMRYLDRNNALTWQALVCHWCANEPNG